MVTFRSEIERIIYKSDLLRFEKFKRFITPGDKILKVGAGLGFQTQLLEDNFPGNVSVVEIENRLHPDVAVPLTIYDGTVIPFEDNNFDVVIANHVLHHTPDPAKLLRELIRVTRKRVIIVEEAWTNKLQKLSIVANCWSKGFRLGEHNQIYFNSYLSRRQWLKLFYDNKLAIESQQGHWQYRKLVPYQVVVFVLHKRVPARGF